MVQETFEGSGKTSEPSKIPTLIASLIQIIEVSFTFVLLCQVDQGTWSMQSDGGQPTAWYAVPRRCALSQLGRHGRHVRHFPHLLLCQWKYWRQVRKSCRVWASRHLCQGWTRRSRWSTNSLRSRHRNWRSSARDCGRVGAQSVEVQTSSRRIRYARWPCRSMPVCQNWRRNVEARFGRIRNSETKNSSRSVDQTFGRRLYEHNGAHYKRRSRQVSSSDL